MGKEIVRFDNELNQVSFRGWSGLEQDLFFGVLAKMQGKGTQEVVFDTDDLRNLIDYAGKDHKRWDQILTGAAKHVMQLIYVERTPHEVAVMALFQTFRVNLDDCTMTVRVSDNYEYIINKLRAKFTQFELAEFAQIRSTYAKTAYRLLKQWRTVGRYEMPVADLRAYFGVPKSYDSYKIRSKVLRPIMEELPAYFAELQVTPVRARKRGRPITGYIFTWAPEAAGGDGWVDGKYGKPATPAKRVIDGSMASPRPAATPESPSVRHIMLRHPYWGEWDQGSVLQHLHGTVEGDDCPLCAAYADNRAYHGCMPD